MPNTFSYIFSENNPDYLLLFLVQIHLQRTAIPISPLRGLTMFCNLFYNNIIPSGITQFHYSTVLFQLFNPLTN